MKLYSGEQQFEVYRLKSKDRLLVAIPAEYVKVIHQAIDEFGKIDLVPVDRTVRGIFLDHGNGTIELDTEEQQNDIVINQIIMN